MTNRYITAGEKAGTQRRMARYRERLRKQGRKAYQFTLSQEEAKRVRAFISRLRVGEAND